MKNSLELCITAVTIIISDIDQGHANLDSITFGRCLQSITSTQGDVTQELQQSHRICGNGPPQSDISVTNPVVFVVFVVVEVVVLVLLRKAQIEAGIIPVMLLFSIRNSLNSLN
jgi:hypothetical protein